MSAASLRIETLTCVWVVSGTGFPAVSSSHQKGESVWTAKNVSPRLLLVYLLAIYLPPSFVVVVVVVVVVVS